MDLRDTTFWGSAAAAFTAADAAYPHPYLKALAAASTAVLGYSAANRRDVCRYLLDTTKCAGPRLPLGSPLREPDLPPDFRG